MIHDNHHVLPKNKQTKIITSFYCRKICNKEQDYVLSDTKMACTCKSLYLILGSSWVKHITVYGIQNYSKKMKNLNHLGSQKINSVVNMTALH